MGKTKYVNYKNASQLMAKGHTMSNGEGKYDWYIMKDGVLYGQFQQDYLIEGEELEILKKSDGWYLID